MDPKSSAISSRISGSGIRYTYEQFKTRFHKIAETLKSWQKKKFNGFILVGNTRVGKSTLFCGSREKEGKYEVKLDNASGKILLEPTTEQMKKLVSAINTSKTETPNISILNGSDDILIIDMPGHSDSSQLKELINFHYIKTMVDFLKGAYFLMVLVVIPDPENKGEFILEDREIKMMASFMQMFPQSHGSISFLVNLLDPDWNQSKIKDAIKSRLLKHKLDEQPDKSKLPGKTLQNEKEKSATKLSFYQYYSKAAEKIFTMKKPKKQEVGKLIPVPQIIRDLPRGVTYQSIQKSLFPKLKIFERGSFKENKEFTQLIEYYWSEGFKKIESIVKQLKAAIEYILIAIANKQGHLLKNAIYTFTDSNAQEQISKRRHKFQRIQLGIFEFTRCYQNIGNLQDLINMQDKDIFGQKFLKLKQSLLNYIEAIWGIVIFTLEGDKDKIQIMNKQFSTVKNMLEERFLEIYFLFTSLPDFNLSRNNQPAGVAMEVPTFVNELDRKMVSLIDFVMQVSNTFDMNNVIVKVCENFVDEDQEKLCAGLKDEKKYDNLIEIYASIQKTFKEYSDKSAEENKQFLNKVNLKMIIVECLKRINVNIPDNNISQNNSRLCNLSKNIPKDKVKMCVKIFLKIASDCEKMQEYEKAIKYYELIRQNYKIKEMIKYLHWQEHPQFLKDRAEYFLREGDFDYAIKLLEMAIHAHGCDFEKIKPIKEKIIQINVNRLDLAQDIEKKFKELTLEKYWSHADMHAGMKKIQTEQFIPATKLIKCLSSPPNPQIDQAKATQEKQSLFGSIPRYLIKTGDRKAALR